MECVAAEHVGADQQHRGKDEQRCDGRKQAVDRSCERLEGAEQTQARADLVRRAVMDEKRLKKAK